MSKYRKLTHVVYKCDYHIVFTPKYRFRILTGQVMSMLEQDIRSICQWKEAELSELSIQIDHVHMIVSIPPRVSVSDFMGILKGKTAIKLFKSYPNLKKKPYWGNHFWARGYFVNTVGINEEMIRRYVKYQENKERQEEQDRSDFTLF
ncbi:MAG: IS200/IS605 family transposase [Bacteroidales bacterium]|nr:IS200/IS605 family transposase [Bacteroidales bacterium]